MILTSWSRRWIRAFSSSMTFWLSIMSVRIDPDAGWLSPGTLIAVSIASPRRFLDAQDFVHVGTAQLENSGHAGHRSDRLELDIHVVEQRPLGLGAVVSEFKEPGAEIHRIDHLDHDVGVFAHVADRLAEELERQRDVILVDRKNLRHGSDVRLAVERTGDDGCGYRALKGGHDFLGQGNGAGHPLNPPPGRNRRASPRSALASD